MAAPPLPQRPPRPGGSPLARGPGGRPGSRGSGRPRSGEMPRSRASASRLALVIVLFLTPIGLLVLPTTILFIIGMIPTMVALVVDRDPEKYAPIIVGSVNLCGIMPAAIQLWRSSHTIGHALRLLADPYNWLVMYSAAGLGWLLFFGVPPLVTAIVTMVHEMEIKRLQERQKELVEEWGQQVAGAGETDELAGAEAGA